MIKNIKSYGVKLFLELNNTKTNVKILQKALNNLGLYLIEDGIFGPITLHLTNKAEPNKLLKEIYTIIFKNKNILKTAIWVDLAKKELGVKEIKGEKHNPRILEYHSVAGGFSTDEVPWCGSFVAFIMLKTGFKLPKYPARAKSWLNFGKSSVVPVYGSIAVKSRKGGGHVCFVIGQSNDGKYLFCLGGNQNDEVNIRKYPKNVFLDFRIPENYIGKGLPIITKKIKKGNKEN